VRVSYRDIRPLTKNADPFSHSGAEESFLETILKHALEDFLRLLGDDQIAGDAAGATVAAVRGVLDPGHLVVEGGFFQLGLAIMNEVTHERVSKG